MIEKTLHKVRRSFFDSVLNNNLIYNTCWEDPRIDRRLLKLNSDSTLLMITSAGCNTLDYLLDDPSRIVAIDNNYRQNALLALKLALFQRGDWSLLFEFFGNGAVYNAEHQYRHVRPFLPAFAQEYWDSHIPYFQKNLQRQTFYYCGSSGTVAWWVRQYLRRKGLLDDVFQLLDAQTTEKQNELFAQIEPRLWPPLLKWVLNRQSTMSMLGVPPSQTALINKEYPGGISRFIRDSIKHIFTELPIKDNYFWQVYLRGYYPQDCTPSYLKQQYFEQLRDRSDRVEMHTTTILKYLKRSSRTFTHFVLLDHMDWLATHDRPTLRDEWTEILKHAAPGAKILFRSAGFNHDFLPDFVFDHLRFDEEQTKELHSRDRVGTYGSTHLATVTTRINHTS